VKELILGTAGHIDHGKTSLIKAISGVDTDRLKEEKERGITIELGFASLDLPSGQHLGIVDVPGHEKFVKNMVAGATGIDIVAMVIAADEGVMPQTREHMEICTLLGIRHGLVVVTKTDLVDEEWLELALEDISEFTLGTFLEEAPVIPVSAAKGDGIPDCITALDDISREIPRHPPATLFRLPVDRVFTMKGFGTVITGTLTSGKIRIGETVMVYPSRLTSKVRGIQVHNQGVEEAVAGMRTAINFQGLEKEAVNRGDVLGSPHALKPSYMVDVAFHYLKSNPRPMKSRTRVRFHAGTSEILGNIILLDREEIAPGEEALVQLRLDSPVAVVRDDRYVIRSYSPVRTIGGGQVLNPIPAKHKRFRKDTLEGLAALTAAEPEKILEHHLKTAGYAGVRFADLKIMTNQTDKELETTLQKQLSAKEVIQIDKEHRSYIHRDNFADLQQEMTSRLQAFHDAHPLKAGMSKEELKSKLPPAMDAKLFNLLLVQMIKDETIVQEENTVRLAAHSVSLGVDQADLRDKILQTYRESGLQPPFFRDIRKKLNVDPAQAADVLQHLIDEGRIVRTKDDLYFDVDAVQELKNRLVAFLEANDEITTPQFKEMTGASRKFVIPLIEYFDSRMVTLRVGDVRKLRRR